MPKFQVFSTKLIWLMLKVVELFTGVLWKSCSDVNFVGKHLNLFLYNVSRPQAKERLLHRCFPMRFTKYFRTLLLQNISVWLLLLNTFFCSLCQPQPQEMFPSILVISNTFEVNTVICLRTALSASFVKNLEEAIRGVL